MIKLKDLLEGGPGSGRPTKPGSKRHMEKGMDKAVADANAKLDAAEKAAKAKKKKKVKEGGPGSGPHGEENPFDREPSDDELADIEKQFEGINEVNFDKVQIPQNVNRFLVKLVQSMKDGNLNRMKRSAILYKVINASGISVQQLTADITKIKKALK